MLISSDHAAAGGSTQRGGYNNMRRVVATALCRRDARNGIGADEKNQKLVVKVIDSVWRKRWRRKRTQWR